MKLIQSFLFITIAFISILIISCENTFTSQNNVIFPDSNVSYQLHVEPFMRFTCAYYGCHSYDYRAGGRDLSSYFALTDNAMNLGLIIPYQPEHSILVKILKREYYHTFNEQWYITDNHIKGISRWIAEGALNN